MSRSRVMQRLGTAFLTWRRYVQQSLVPHRITLKQMYVLRQLVRHRFLYPSQIADMLYCDRPTATVIIRNMERQGWVRREQDKGDRRQVRVILTAPGRAKLDEIAPSAVAGGEDGDVEGSESRFDPLACFDEWEVRELDRLLTRLNKHLQEAEPGREGR